MRDVWKEFQLRGEEEEPLAAGPSRAAACDGRPAAGAGGRDSKGAYGGAGVQEELDFFDTGFTLREAGPQVVRPWLCLQVAALFFQFVLWCEVGNHLEEFDDVIAQACTPDRVKHGVCLGSLWNITSWQDVVLKSGNPWHTFDFFTASTPPTFLLSVDPVTRARSRDLALPAAAPDLSAETEALTDARWTLEVLRLDPPQAAPAMKKHHSGPQALTFEDLSTEAAEALWSRGRVHWRAKLQNRGPWRYDIRYVAYVEDFNTAHMPEVRQNHQCQFSLAWKAFNEQHQGHSHRMLAWCRSLLGVFLCLGSWSLYLVYAELSGRRRGPMLGSDKLASIVAPGYRFHLVVALKFLLQDVPQQVCIVLYVLGWYEAAGLRCQLCLFRPAHCGAEQAFHPANCIAIGLSLLSSVATQLLVRPAFRRTYTEDDICLQYVIRVGGACVATLPFTTGLCAAGRSVLPAPGFVHLLAAVPCGIGWLTLTGCMCIPIMFMCDDDDI